MGHSKLDRLITTTDDATGAEVTALAGPLTSTVNVTTHDNFAIQVEYGAGPAGDLTLEASLDGSVWTPVAGSTQALDVAGGTHVWNITEFHAPYVRVDVPVATADVTIKFAGVKVGFDG